MSVRTPFETEKGREAGSVGKTTPWSPRTTASKATRSVSASAGRDSESAFVLPVWRCQYSVAKRFPVSFVWRTALSGVMQAIGNSAKKRTAPTPATP